MMVKKALSLMIWITWLPITGPAASNKRRQDDATKQPKLGEAEGDAGFNRLPRLRHPGAAQDLGHVGGVVDGQRDQAGGPVVEVGCRATASRNRRYRRTAGTARSACHRRSTRAAHATGRFRHQRRRQREPEQQRGNGRQHRQDRGIGEPAQHQAALGSIRCRNRGSCQRLGGAWRRSIQRCS